MTRIGRQLGIGIAIFIAACSAAQGKGPELEAYGPGQSAADILRDVSGADGAFLAAGMINSKVYSPDNLAKMLEFPNETVVIVSLTGTQIRQAFERSLSLYPQPNWAFLQISGFEVVFNPEAPANQRVKSILAAGLKLDETKTYSIAMPVGLARGGYGYFKIWNETKIKSTVPDMTVEKALAGKKFVESKPRWVAQS